MLLYLFSSHQNKASVLLSFFETVIKMIISIFQLTMTSSYIYQTEKKLFHPFIMSLNFVLCYLQFPVEVRKWVVLSDAYRRCHKHSIMPGIKGVMPTFHVEISLHPKCCCARWRLIHSGTWGNVTDGPYFSHKRCSRNSMSKWKLKNASIQRWYKTLTDIFMHQKAWKLYNKRPTCICHQKSKHITPITYIAFAYPHVLLINSSPIYWLH